MNWFLNFRGMYCDNLKKALQKQCLPDPCQWKASCSSVETHLLLCQQHFCANKINAICILSLKFQGVKFLFVMASTRSADELFLIGIRNLEPLVNLNQLPTLRQVLQRFHYYLKESKSVCKL